MEFKVGSVSFRSPLLFKGAPMETIRPAVPLSGVRPRKWAPLMSLGILHAAVDARLPLGLFLHRLAELLTTSDAWRDAFMLCLFFSSCPLVPPRAPSPLLFFPLVRTVVAATPRKCPTCLFPRLLQMNLPIPRIVMDQGALQQAGARSSLQRPVPWSFF